MWGRNVYDSICKFLQFQLTVNIAAILTCLVGIFRYQDSPLHAVQMLWINLIMDSLASLALATEPPSEKQLERPPVNRSESIISEQMCCNMFGHAAYQTCVMMLLYFDHGPSIFRCEPMQSPNGKHAPRVASVHATALFNTFVMMTLFNEINCRKLEGEYNVFKGILNNKYFISIWLLTMAVQILGVQCAGGLLHVNPDGLTQWQWFVCLCFGAGEIPVQQLINLLHVCIKSTPKDQPTPSSLRSGGVLKFGKGRVMLSHKIQSQRQLQHQSSIENVLRVVSTRSARKLTIQQTSPLVSGAYLVP